MYVDVLAEVGSVSCTLFAARFSVVTSIIMEAHFTIMSATRILICCYLCQVIRFTCTWITCELEARML